MSLLLYLNKETLPKGRKSKWQKTKGKNFAGLLTVILFFLFSFFFSSSIFAQCQSNDRNQGLISATQGIIGNTLFGNFEQVCITGTQDASYREFKVPSYQDLEDQFYTLTRSTFKKGVDLLPTNGTWDFTNAGNGIYLQSNPSVPTITLNSVIPTSTTDPPSGVQVIFVTGNLDITGDILYAETDSLSGLVFIVQGDINIYTAVTKINAVLISTGLICTSYNAGLGCSDGSAFTEQLVINGSLISLNKTLPAGAPIQLRRNLLVNDAPAEVVNKQPKYLYILRGGLLTKDLIITTEDQHYPITTTGDPPPPPPPPPPPGPVICSPVPNPTGADNIQIPGCICIDSGASC